MMEFNRVLLIFKKLYEIKKTCLKGPRERIEQEHRHHVQTHIESIEEICRILKKLRINYVLSERGKLKTKPAGVGMIITIGGDGTLLCAAHLAGKAPVLGVNSDTNSSLGRFCSANTLNFEKIIRMIMDKRLKPSILPLLEARIEGRMISTHAVNDILVSSSMPAESLKYYIEVGEKAERQSSSGVWISTPAGSSGGLGSAGGKLQKMFEKDTQYIVREPLLMHKKRYSLMHGFVKKGESIKITPTTKNCFAYIDGAHESRHIPIGNTLTVRASNNILNIFIQKDHQS